MSDLNFNPGILGVYEPQIKQQSTGEVLITLPERTEIVIPKFNSQLSVRASLPLSDSDIISVTYPLENKEYDDTKIDMQVITASKLDNSVLPRGTLYLGSTVTMTIPYVFAVQLQKFLLGELE